MESNTAKKLTASQLIHEFNEQGINLDLLKVFLITGTTDISKAAELISKWSRGASGDAKAMLESDITDLQFIMHRRVEMTKAFYEVGAPVTEKKETTEPGEAKVIKMSPKLDKLEDIIAKVTRILQGGKGSNNAIQGALTVLKKTVGQGQVIDSEGKTVLWDNEKINAFLQENDPNKEEAKQTPKVGFGTVCNYIEDLVKANKSAEEVKTFTRTIVTGKIITNKGGDYLILNDTVYEDYWNRILSALTTHAIEQFESSKSTEDKDKQIEAKIETTVKPFLQLIEKEGKEISLAKATNMLSGIYKSFGIKMGLQEVLKKVEVLAETLAPTILAKRKERDKSQKPITSQSAAATETIIAEPEVYDDAHNIKESNKELWAEVENYALLDDIYKKSVVLIKEGKWKDALCMCLLLISSGKIKEIPDSKDPITWNESQIKDWFHNNVLSTINKELIGPVPKQGFTKALENAGNKSLDVSIPAPAESAKSEVARLLKDSTQWKDKYKFKSFNVPVEHYASKNMVFEVTDATPEQEPALLITEANFTKFLDSQKDVLVKDTNRIKDVRKTLMSTLSPFYEITHSECKSIAGGLLKDACALKKEAKEVREIEKKDKSEEIIPDEPDNDEVFIDKFEVGEPISETRGGRQVPMRDGEYIIPDFKGADQEITVKDGKVFLIVAVKAETKDDVGDVPEEKKEEKTSPLPEDPAKSQESVKDQKVVKDQVKSIENTAGELSSNSNDVTSPVADDNKEVKTKVVETLSVEGFEDIAKAHDKVAFHKAIYAKVETYAKREDGEKAVFEFVDKLRKDSHYKHSFARSGYKNAEEVDLLAGLKRIIENGDSIKAQQSK